jgi:hypothetical protein
MVGFTQRDAAATGQASRQTTATQPSVAWRQTYDRSGTYDLFDDLVGTSDGGAILVGSTDTDTYDDGWVIKIGSEGAEQWRRSVDLQEKEVHFDYVVETDSGGVLLVGKTESDENIFGALAVKIGTNGAIQWQKTFDNDGDDLYPSDAIGTDTGGVLFTGTTGSDGLIIKLGGDGSVQWRQSVDRQDESNSFHAIVTTSDGGAILAGETATGNSYDGWVVKMGSDGTEQWRNTFDGYGHHDYFVDVVSTGAGGAIVVGLTKTGGGAADYAGWGIKVDSDGTEQWRNIFDDGDP